MRTTLITAGSRGIGRAIALAFAEDVTASEPNERHVIVSGRRAEPVPHLRRAGDGLMFAGDPTSAGE